MNFFWFFFRERKKAFACLREMSSSPKVAQVGQPPCWIDAAGGEALLRDYLDAADGNPVFDQPRVCRKRMDGCLARAGSVASLVGQLMNDDVTMSGAQQSALMAEMSDLIDDNIVFSPPTYWQSRRK